MTTQTASHVRMIKGHRIRISIQHEEWQFYAGHCETCKKSLSCGFPYYYILHSARHHAGDCDCPGPDLTTWI